MSIGEVGQESKNKNGLGYSCDVGAMTERRRSPPTFVDTCITNLPSEA